MNNIFSLNRTVKIIRKDMFSEYKNLIIWFSTVGGVMIVLSALIVLINKYQGGGNLGNSQFHEIFFLILLFLGGFILTSAMFKDAHDKSKNIYWLTLPGSTFEKLLSRLLISSVFFVILLTLFYPLLAMVSELFNLAVFGDRRSFFNPFTKDIFKMIPYYLVGQSLFFAGAASYRKHPFAKTLLSLAAFNIAITILTVLFLRIFFGSYFTNLQDINVNFNLMNFTGSSADRWNELTKTASLIAKILFWGFTAPFFYVLSYFKLAEKEVRDGF